MYTRYHSQPLRNRKVWALLTLWTAIFYGGAVLSGILRGTRPLVVLPHDLIGIAATFALGIVVIALHVYAPVNWRRLLGDREGR